MVKLYFVLSNLYRDAPSNKSNNYMKEIFALA